MVRVTTVNCGATGFGGDDWKTLYFTTRTHLFAVNVKIPGVAVPPQKP